MQRVAKPIVRASQLRATDSSYATGGARRYGAMRTVPVRSNWAAERPRRTAKWKSLQWRGKDPGYFEAL